jgi:hypothetical protein
MDTRKSHHIWMEQCEAAHSIRERYGVAAAFDYLVGKKLMTFAAAAADHPEFARELPRFMSEVRRMFTANEIGVHFGANRARTERDRRMLWRKKMFFLRVPLPLWRESGVSCWSRSY